MFFKCLAYAAVAGLFVWLLDEVEVETSKGGRFRLRMVLPEDREEDTGCCGGMVIPLWEDDGGQGETGDEGLEDPAPNDGDPVGTEEGPTGEDAPPPPTGETGVAPEPSLS